MEWRYEGASAGGGGVGVSVGSWKREEMSWGLGRLVAVRVEEGRVCAVRCSHGKIFGEDAEDM